MSAKKREALGAAFALTAGTAWGFSGTAGQYLFQEKGLNSGWLTVARMLSAGLVLLLSLLLTKKRGELLRIWKNKKDAIRLALFSVLGLMAVQYSYMAAISHSNSGTATALQYLGQAVILVWVCLSGRRLPVKRELLALGLALLGAFVLATHGEFGSLAITRGALLWGLAAAVSLAVYTLSPAPLIREYGSPVVTGYGMLIGGFALMLITGWEPGGVSLDGGAIAALIAIVLIGTVGAFSLYLASVAMIGGVKAGLLSCTEMLSAPVFAAVWLGTEFHGMDVAGFVLMVLMVYVLSRGGTSEQ